MGMRGGKFINIFGFLYLFKIFLSVRAQYFSQLLYFGDRGGGDTRNFENNTRNAFI